MQKTGCLTLYRKDIKRDCHVATLLAKTLLGRVDAESGILHAKNGCGIWHAAFKERMLKNACLSRCLTDALKTSNRTGQCNVYILVKAYTFSLSFFYYFAVQLLWYAHHELAAVFLYRARFRNGQVIFTS